MLSVQSPAVLDMSPTDAPDAAATTQWSWRNSHLPTPPVSVHIHQRAAKPHYAAQLAAQAHEHDRHVTLPPIAHLDRHWPSTSPRTSLAHHLKPAFVLLTTLIPPFRGGL